MRLIPIAIAAVLGLGLAAGDIPGDVLDDVRGDDEGKRRTAVTKLADIGTPEAWELVAERLADEEPEVADRAQIELARIDGEDALARGLLQGAGDGLGGIGGRVIFGSSGKGGHPGGGQGTGNVPGRPGGTCGIRQRQSLRPESRSGFRRPR